jgi:RsiW-degrading membrane proteinase PrsW (M82 family)
MNELHVTFDGRSYSFQPGQTVRIGRESDSEVVVGDPTVSRQQAQLTWGPDGWVFENLGRAPAFLGGQSIPRVVVREAMDVALASPDGPVLRIEPSPAPATQAATQAATGPGDPHVTSGFGGTQATAGAGNPQETRWAQDPQQTHAAAGFVPQGGAVPRASSHAPAQPKDELATAFHILVPIKSWLRDPGWRKGLRLLVIPYALLPLLFLALFSSSGSLSTPGFAYSLYIAPLWAIAFWLLLRPGPITRLDVEIGVGIVAFVVIWLYAVTIKIDSHLATVGKPIPFVAAIGVGYNEEITKALPVLLAALLLLKFRSTKLDVRMWMLLGTISGLTFGVLEEKTYTAQALVIIAGARANSQADAGVLDFAFRVFTDGFQHAIWAGVSAFFIGMAVNYPRRRWQLVLFGVSIAAFLHAFNDWIVSNYTLWPWIGVQAISLFLFIGYTMSANSIERQVRRTPMFRGESMLMDKFSESRDAGTS